MIEFLVGVAFGIFTRDLGGHVFEDRTQELEAENRQMRQALRYIRATVTVTHIRAYIDRLLSDEAGA